MWDWWCCCRRKDKGEHHHHHHEQTLLIIQNDDQEHPYPPTATIAMILTSWLSRRRRRYLFLALCSPFLLPFLCATFPLLCVAEICLRLCRLRRRHQPKKAPHEDRDGDGLRRCEEGGGGGEVKLLQRYLEDQLLLVVGSVYDCGELDDEDDVDFFETSRSRLLPE